MEIKVSDREVFQAAAGKRSGLFARPCVVLRPPSESCGSRVQGSLWHSLACHISCRLVFQGSVIPYSHVPVSRSCVARGQRVPRALLQTCSCCCCGVWALPGFEPSKSFSLGHWKAKLSTLALFLSHRGRWKELKGNTISARKMLAFSVLFSF